MSNELNFCYAENLSLVFELLLQYDELRFCPKVSSSGRKRIFLFIESVLSSDPMQLCLRTRGRSMSETPTSKTDLLIFLTNKRLLAGTIYRRFLIYLKAMKHEPKKIKEIYFLTLYHEIKILVGFS